MIFLFTQKYNVKLLKSIPFLALSPYEHTKSQQKGLFNVQ